MKKPTKIPKYGETSADALRALRKSGRDLTWKARIYLAIHFLQPCTRRQVTDFFRQEGERWVVRHSSVTGRITELMDEGLVKCVGGTEDPLTKEKVELLGIGRDERLKYKRHNAMRYPDPEKAVAEADRAGFERGRLEGLGIGFIFGLCLALAIAIAALLLEVFGVPL